MRPDSERTILGAALCRPQHNYTLIICEGELNAVTIDAHAGPGVDVVSFGSKEPSQLALSLMGKLAARYKLIVVWADNADNTRKIAKAVGRPLATYLRQSPHGLDANDILQKGGAAAFVEFMGLVRGGAFDTLTKDIAKEYEQAAPDRRAALSAFYDDVEAATLQRPIDDLFPLSALPSGQQSQLKALWAAQPPARARAVV